MRTEERPAVLQRAETDENPGIPTPMDIDWSNLWLGGF